MIIIITVVIIIKMIADQVYTKMMLSGLEEGVAAVERERARVTKIISDKVDFIILFMTRRTMAEMIVGQSIKMPI